MALYSVVRSIAYMYFTLSPAPHIASSLRRLFFIWPRFIKQCGSDKAVRMDTRAWRNPYHDYNGSPACTQALFDSQGKVMHEGCGQVMHVTVTLIIFNVFSFFFFLHLQLTSEFAQRLSSKISELLAVMENGLKSADPRDCTSYTGWAGDDDTITHLI